MFSAKKTTYLVPLALFVPLAARFRVPGFLLVTGAVCLGATAGFLTAGFTGPPIRLRASAALNGNCRADFSPVVLRVSSTRRLFARTMVCRLRRIFALSAGV